MAGQGILIIIIPNDLNNEQEKSLDIPQVGSWIEAGGNGFLFI